MTTYTGGRLVENLIQMATADVFAVWYCPYCGHGWTPDIITIVCDFMEKAVCPKCKNEILRGA